MKTHQANPTDITVEQMRDCCVHHGHKLKFCHPDMMRYVSGVKNEMAFIDLNKSLEMMNEACVFLHNVVYGGGKVLFVGTKFLKKYKHIDLVKEYADKCSSFYVSKRWLGGTLTNLSVIRKSCEELEHLNYQIARGILPRLKKEQVAQRKKLEALESRFGGIVGMSNPPQVVIILDRKYEEVAVREAQEMKIPVIAVVDTNSKISDINYPIPGNDDAISCLELYLSSFSKVIQQAQEQIKSNKTEIKEVDEKTLKQAAENSPEDISPESKT